jgi:hypothetical protein
MVKGDIIKSKYNPLKKFRQHGRGGTHPQTHLINRHANDAFLEDNIINKCIFQQDPK